MNFTLLENHISREPDLKKKMKNGLSIIEIA